MAAWGDGQPTVLTPIDPNKTERVTRNGDPLLMEITFGGLYTSPPYEMLATMNDQEHLSRLRYRRLALLHSTCTALPSTLEPSILGGHTLEAQGSSIVKVLSRDSSKHPSFPAPLHR
jgi:hypothetical protein